MAVVTETEYHIVNSDGSKEGHQRASDGRVREIRVSALGERTTTPWQFGVEGTIQ